MPACSILTVKEKWQLPFFLLIPLLMSGIITSDSFAGERERNTLEALLTTPIRDWELLLGKILTPFLPALLVTWTSFLLLTKGIANLINPHFLSPVFPDAIWIISVALVVPLFLVGTVLAEILISARVSSVKADSALNMLLAFPVLAGDSLMHLAIPVAEYHRGTSRRSNMGPERRYVEFLSPRPGRATSLTPDAAAR